MLVFWNITNFSDDPLENSNKFRYVVFCGNFKWARMFSLKPPQLWQQFLDEKSKEKNDYLEEDV